MIAANADPALVAQQVIDTVGNVSPQFLVDKIMNLDLIGRTLGMPFPPRVAIVAHQFLLLGVHADHGLASLLKRQNLFVDMAELPVAVGMALAFIPFARSEERR